VLAGLTHAASLAEVTLRQMEPGSDLLQDLSRGPAPSTPYFVIGGNTSLLAAATDQERRAKLQRLLSRLWSDRTKYDLADKLFAGADNDIAVSLTSMRNLPERAAPRWDLRTVGCDHMSYFSNAAGLEALSQVLR
jgi:hypothetical protein